MNVGHSLRECQATRGASRLHFFRTQLHVGHSLRECQATRGASRLHSFRTQLLTAGTLDAHLHAIQAPLAVMNSVWRSLAAEADVAGPRLGHVDVLDLLAGRDRTRSRPCR